MKTPEMKDSVQEGNSFYKVEHVPDFDVIFNLDAKGLKYRDAFFSLLKKFSDSEKEEKGNGNWEYGLELKFAFEDLLDDNGQQIFHCNSKYEPQVSVDFILGRTDEDPVSPWVKHDFDTRARYAFASVLNEVVLSKKIKGLVNSEKFQKLAQKHGFTRMIFSEPIAAIVVKKLKNKIVIYKYIHEGDFLDRDFHLPELVKELRKMFLENRIIPNDLRSSQFMIEMQSDGPALYLLDTEAYREIIDSPKIEKLSH